MQGLQPYYKPLYNPKQQSCKVAGWIEQEHWKGADLVAGCTPLWACVALFQAADFLKLWAVLHGPL